MRVSLLLIGPILLSGCNARNQEDAFDRQTLTAVVQLQSPTFGATELSGTCQVFDRQVNVNAFDGDDLIQLGFHLVEGESAFPPVDVTGALVRRALQNYALRNPAVSEIEPNGLDGRLNASGASGEDPSRSIDEPITASWVCTSPKK